MKTSEGAPVVKARGGKPNPLKPDIAGVQTVRGRVSADDLGCTLIHEHVFNLYRAEYRDQVTAHTLSELSRLRARGVSTIVDLTPYAQLGTYEEVIAQSPVRLISCAGFHLPHHIPARYRQADLEVLTGDLLRRVSCGVGRGHTLPGCLKIAGRHPEPDALEKRIFEAVGRVHVETGLPIVTHSPRGAVAHVRMLQSAGVEAPRILISHLDTYLSESSFAGTLADAIRLLDSGVNILLTEFGSSPCPKLGQKASLVVSLAAEAKSRGFIRQLFLSSDSWWSWRHGAARMRPDAPGRRRTHDYVLDMGLLLLQGAGFTQDDFYSIFTRNPARFLFVE